MAVIFHSNTKRIAKNTIFLYIRMLLIMAVTLYTSRVVLDKLGISDYGTYNVVGGIVSMLGFLNNAMSNAVQRYLSFEIGKKNEIRVNHIFNVSMIAHINIALFFLIVMEIAGVWYLNNFLNVHPSRLDAAHWVLQCSIVTTVFSIMQVPYTAIIISKEKMGIYAYISIIEVTLKLLAVYFLSIADIDRLKLYAVLMMVVQIFILMINRIYCIKKYKEANFKIVNDIPLLKEILGFASWNVLGEIAWVFTGQGVNMILNVFFGPVVNAARGIAEQVNGAVSKFVSNFQVALNPQIIKTYAAEDWEETMRLVYRGTRFSYYLVFALSLPLIIEMETILNIWLRKVPEYSVIFCQLILVNSMIMSISNLLSQIARAYGKIRNYQIVVSVILAFNFPLSYLFLKLGASPVATVVVNMAIQFVLIFVRLFLTKKMITYRFMEFLRQIFIPIAKVSIMAIFLPVILKFYLPNNRISFLMILSVSCVSVLLSAYVLGMNKHEQALIRGFASNVYKKIIIKR